MRAFAFALTVAVLAAGVSIAQEKKADPPKPAEVKLPDGVTKGVTVEGVTEYKLKNGVRIFEYRHTLLHQKVMIVDGKWSCVGSTNFDDRSFLLNDEVSVGFTNERIAQELRDAWFDDLRYCQDVHFDEWRTRPWPHKLLDGAGFLLRREL